MALKSHPVFKVALALSSSVTLVVLLPFSGLQHPRVQCERRRKLSKKAGDDVWVLTVLGQRRWASSPHFWTVLKNYPQPPEEAARPTLSGPLLGF